MQRSRHNLLAIVEMCEFWVFVFAGKKYLCSADTSFYETKSNLLVENLIKKAFLNIMLLYITIICELNYFSRVPKSVGLDKNFAIHMTMYAWQSKPQGAYLF